MSGGLQPVMFNRQSSDPNPSASVNISSMAGGMGSMASHPSGMGASNEMQFLSSPVDNSGGDAMSQRYGQPSYNDNFGAPPPTSSSTSNVGTGGTINTGNAFSGMNFEDEPPLLEELGIDATHIRQKTLAVMMARPMSKQLVEDVDMGGPLLFCLMLGSFLLLTGKVHFGYIYGFGFIGCLLMNLILNLMSEEGIDLYRTMSILGYCLLPIVLLAGLNVVINLKGIIGTSAAGLAISWCTITATRFIENALDMREQRYLVAYPAALLYSAFAMLTIF
jgi:protein YIPF5/7